MKQNIRTKWFALTLTAALALTTLTACGNGAGTASPPETPATSAPLLEESGGVAGTVLLSVNPEIEMDYDDLGNVVALTGRNQEAQTLLASYTGYEGRPCTQVVGELVDEINALGYFDATVGGHEKNIILKLERGSVYPNDQFLNELAEAVRLVVETDQIGSQAVTLDQDDYDDAYGDKGYINASAAQSILSTQLGRDDLQFVEKEYDLDDGEYEVEFVLDGVEYEYEVNAYTGKVTEMDAEFQDYDDTDYGPNADGITDYDDTDYGPNADGITDYDDTDYGPNNDGITDYDDTDYGPNADGITDYDDTDYGPNADGITDYDDTDYGPNADGITDYDDTGYGPNADGITDYDDTDYGPNADGITDYDDWGDDDDWYGDPTGEDHWDDDDDGWDDTDYDDRDDDGDWDDDWDD
ncbi:PepSY domain-containing protein [Dysosmobacter sp.]|uniref:PepSY domain-containing protein n=1 Tax=Dysosmobacter sp. TaxID=2591382 RepID=UPI003AF117DC